VLPLVDLIKTWSITLGWQDVLNVGLAAVAVWQAIRARRTSQICQQVLRRQAGQTAAHGFAEMAREAYDLETSLRRGDWERSLDLAKQLIVSLAEGLGAWSVILEPSDKDNAEASRNEIMSVERSIPGQGDDHQITEELREDMRNRCITATMLLAEIAGRLKTPAELAETPRRKAKAK
jgi:hypothetical protein